MRRFIVRYKVKPDRAQENRDLIRNVFAELKERAPAGVAYSVSVGLDGVSFFHLVSVDTDAGETPIAELASFKAFQAGIRERCAEAPVRTDLEAIPVGSYGE